MGSGIVAPVAEGHVIGVDLGGTKLLAGAVGADEAVVHRTNRPVMGLTEDELVQMVGDAVEEIRTAVGTPIEAGGFGIPRPVDPRTRTGREGGQRAPPGNPLGGGGGPRP